MKAVTMLEPGAMRLIEIPEPTVGPEDVLIDVHYIGLCGSDLSAYRGQSPMVSYPRIPGHEISGVVIGKGAAVPERLTLGARVTVSPYTECGLCPACRQGRVNCCEFNQTLGVQREGALTERIVADYRKVYASASLSAIEMALVEPLSVGYHATNRGKVGETDTVLAIGCGTIGMGVIAAAVRKGATVFAADIEPAKLETARRFGARHTFCTDHDILPELRALTDNEGVSVAIEAVGRPETYQLAVAAACYAGRVVTIGYAKQPVSFDTSEFVRKEMDIRGSRNALRVFPAVIQMLERRAQPFESLVTRIYPLAEAPQAFPDWQAAPGEVNKLLVDVKG